MPGYHHWTGAGVLDRDIAAAALSAVTRSEAHSDAQSIVLVDAKGSALAHSGQTAEAVPVGALHVARFCLDAEEIGSELAPELNGLARPAGPWAPAALPIRHGMCGLLGAIGVSSTAGADNLRLAEIGQETAIALLSGEMA